MPISLHFPQSAALLAVLTLAAPTVRAQTTTAKDGSLNGRIQQFTGILRPAVAGYTQPISTSLGTALNSGLFRSADVHGLLGFEVGVQIIGVMVPDKDRLFTVDLFNPLTGGTERITTSTAFGPTEGATVFGAGKVPGGIDFKYVPVLIPQAMVGLPIVGEVMVRYLPKVQISKDIGELELLGVGLRHDLDHYIPFFPVDVALGAAYQQFKVGTTATSKNFAVNLVVSKSLPAKLVPIFIPYIGVQYESTKTDYSYTYTPQLTNGQSLAPVTIAYSQDGLNTGTRATAGFSLRVFPGYLNLGYSIGKYQAANLGLGLSFR